jgi:hypothetical protein
MSRHLYDSVICIYGEATSWKEFEELVKKGHYKWILLEAIEAGWASKIEKDLEDRYGSSQDIGALIKKYKSIVNNMDLLAPSSSELMRLIKDRTDKINRLRGYLRYANYTRRDEPDDIIWTIDAELAELGSGTPTREACAKSYSYITETIVPSGALVVDTKDADRLASYLAGILEETLKALSQLDPVNKENVRAEAIEIDNLHCNLTGRRLLGSEFHEEEGVFNKISARVTSKS